MNHSYMLICMGLMALVTYLPRMIPLVFFRRKIESRFVRSFFHYVPYAVLAAMTFPDVLFSTNGIPSALAGLAVGLLLAWKERGLMTVALGASATVFIVERIMTFF